MGCGSTLAKIFLVIFNIIFFLVGCALLAVGIYVLVNPQGAQLFAIVTRDFNDPLLRVAAIVVTAVGALVLLVSLFGCVGACCENTCMLLTYAVIVGLMLIIQVVGGILAAIYMSRIEGWLKTEMNNGLDTYNAQNARSSSVDAMQVLLKCCGVDGSGDWTGNKRSARNNTWTNDFPASCCKLREADPGKITDGNFQANCKGGVSGSYYTSGCYESLKKWLKDNSKILIGVAFGLVIVEILVIVMACCLRSAIMREKEGTV